MDRILFEEVLKRCERIVNKRFTENLRPYSRELLKKISEKNNIIYISSME